jgi:HAMP domain-containing protein
MHVDADALIGVCLPARTELTLWLGTSRSISTTHRERTQLEALVRQHTTPQQLAIRARIIRAAAAGAGVGETAASLQVSRSLVQRWCRRWRERGWRQSGRPKASRRAASMR